MQFSRFFMRFGRYMKRALTPYTGWNIQDCETFILASFHLKLVQSPVGTPYCVRVTGYRCVLHFCEINFWRKLKNTKFGNDALSILWKNPVLTALTFKVNNMFRSSLFCASYVLAKLINFWPQFFHRPKFQFLKKTKISTKILLFLRGTSMQCRKGELPGTGEQNDFSPRSPVSPVECSPFPPGSPWYFFEIFLF